MLQSLCVIFLLSVLGGSTQGELISKASLPQDSKSPCSYPPQWEGYLSQYVLTQFPQGPSSTFQLLGGFYVDQIKEKASLKMEMDVDGNKTKLFILLDFPQKVIYWGYPDSRTCKKAPTPYPMAPQGVPGSATLLGSFRFGLGSNSAKVDSWGALVPIKYPWAAVVSLNIVATDDKCVPILERGINDNAYAKSNFENTFSDVNATFSDPSVFDVPDYCTSSTVSMTDGIDPLIASIVGRFFKWW